MPSQISEDLLPYASNLLQGARGGSMVEGAKEALAAAEDVRKQIWTTPVLIVLGDLNSVLDGNGPHSDTDGSPADLS